MVHHEQARVGLVLTGGGARGAYQAGALRAIAEMMGANPFAILTGVSAGGLNCSFLAAHSGDFLEGTRGLWDLWAGLRSGRVFRTESSVLTRIGARLLAELSLGALVRGRHVNYLLDTSPLRQLVEASVSAAALRDAVVSGRLYGIAVTATNYYSGTALSFYDGHPSIEPWTRSARIGVRAELGPAHVMASAALPVFFPPVAVDGSYYGDGCIRLSAPLSPAIHLGASRILAIGIRYPRSADRTLELNQASENSSPALAQIGGVLLNAVFLDSLEVDAERLQRINRTLSLIPEEKRGLNGLRPIPFYALRPSRDLGAMAAELFDSFPVAIRHMLRGIGASKESGSDLLSYLAFESAYTGRLLALGYADAMAERGPLEAFLRGDTAPLQS